MVYVDEPDKPYGRMMMCHMMADTHAELIEMAQKIGVAVKWIQYPGTPREHFDVCKTYRLKAISHGAIALSNRELAQWSIRKRAAQTPANA